MTYKEAQEEYFNCKTLYEQWGSTFSLSFDDWVEDCRIDIIDE